LQKLLYQDVNANSPTYLNKYPKLKNVMTDRSPNIFSNNLVFMCGEATDRQGPGSLTTQNNVITNNDPGFVDMRAKNFELKSDSPIFRQLPGLKSISFKNIGLFVDEYRLTK
jgi:hypothetical protein